MNIEKSSLISFIPITKFRFAFLSILTFLALSGCNKTQDFENLELLTNTNWHLTSRTQNGIDITNDCDLDDILLFEDAKNFKYDYGVLKCVEDNTLKKVSDTWKMIDDFSVLRIKYKFSGNGGGSLVEYWKIIELSETTLIIEDDLAGDNDQIPEIRTYLK